VKLTLLRDALRKLTAELADGDAFRDPDRVGRLLSSSPGLSSSPSS
jgi:hypothetical protein